ncbi:hypothetical protein FN846DRAFT_549991 [Sphaerosporella brunnea]|uniref:Uncharacterized protein n=1 Tax=Sphaerosporella brunnea TaxID=1250544 RepID=A0A5J5EEU6_9PEZI|nr:hypothetical protein FN846DRAFT_549991 [Sphaerosporella brunnea]
MDSISYPLHTHVRTSAISSQPGAVVPFTYRLHVKRAERQPYGLNQGGGSGDSIHLPPAWQSEPNVSHIVSTREAGAGIPSTYHLHGKASRTSPISSQLGRRELGFHPLTSCMTKRAERQPYCLNQGGGSMDSISYPLHTHVRTSAISSQAWRREGIGFTYHLHCTVSQTSAISSRPERCGDIILLRAATTNESNVSCTINMKRN